MTTEREQDGTDAPAADDIDALKAQLDEEREKAQANYAGWQRAAADYQNFKRRVEEERSETARFANAALVINMLPLLDDLDRALRNVDAHLAGLTWVDGIRLIHRKFQALVEMAGVEEIDADGQPFDPAQHEAVSQAPGEEGKVVAVVQKGYKLGDRVIRPAMVVVGLCSTDQDQGAKDQEPAT
ncbi:MAG: nucleotide exchange factor GrpE [Dehalococcoidia bacterium]